MTKALHWLAAGSALIAAPVSADTVCEWADFAQAIQTAAAPPPSAPRTPDHERAQTQVALAMFEALNAIDRRYETYLGMSVADPKASEDAAAATAAHEVLIAHFPSQKSALDESYAITLETVPDQRSRDAGIAIGKAAAALALKSGGIDPAIAQIPYLPRAQAGVWVPTQLPVFEPFATAFKPWIMEKADSVRPGPPPSLDSEVWVRDYNEVKRLGGKASKDRTPHETLMARYRITPNMMPSYRLAADAPGRTPVQNARMFAMLGMINDDAFIAIIDAKLHYNFWRPITAIRNGDIDGNDATERDAGWTPLNATPMHPEYPSQAAIICGVAVAILESVFGPKPAIPFTVTDLADPNVKREYDSIAALADEHMNVRVWGGIHFRNSLEIGEDMGKRIAAYLIESSLKPAR